MLHTLQTNPWFYLLNGEFDLNGLLAVSTKMHLLAASSCHNIFRTSLHKELITVRTFCNAQFTWDNFENGIDYTK